MTGHVERQCRPHYKAGNWTERGVNLCAVSRWGMTRSARRALAQSQFEDDQTAAREARRKEVERRTAAREKRKQDRENPVPQPGFLARVMRRLAGK
jgi:hypothetical protein